jgi:hypothetical protein
MEIGGEGLAASMAAMEKMDQTAAMTTAMNAEFQTQKMMTDTLNAIANGQVDSANKAVNAATQSGKSIQY